MKKIYIINEKIYIIKKRTLFLLNIRYLVFDHACNYSMST
jgi:hypothetical protein